MPVLFLKLVSHTALLLREQERAGMIHLRQFYARRILQIWPLYYWGVTLGVIAGLLVPAWHWGYKEVAEMIFFFGSLGG